MTSATILGVVIGYLLILLAIGVWNAALPSSDLVLVPRLMAKVNPIVRYTPNSSDPGLGLDWTQPGFQDGGWNSGDYGVGYEAPGEQGARALILSSVPLGTSSVFTRAHFDVADPQTVGQLLLGVDYDDGAIIWLNGVEIWRSPSMPAGAPAVAASCSAWISSSKRERSV